MVLIDDLGGGPPRYGLLGPLRIVSGGAEIAVTSRLQRKILTTLLLSPRAVVSADALEFVLWNDEPPATARKTLQSLVSRLRGLLGTGEIVTQPPGYRIEAEDTDVDAVLFERLVEETDARIAREPHAALRLVDHALGLWRGEAIAEFADELFAMTEAHRLGELRLAAIELRFDALLALGRHESLIPELEAFISEHPVRERPRNRLMMALHQSGRAPEALAVFHEFRELLAEELGLDPSSAMQELELRILNDDATLSSDVTDTPAAVSGVHDTWRVRLPQPPVLLGREGELDRLDTMARDALTTVVGPGGVGKTSLVSVWSDTQPAVSIVELSDLHHEADLVAGLTQQLGMDAQTGDPKASLINRLSVSGAALVIDNCEHLLDAVRDLVADIIRLSPQVRVICTSRQRLDLPDEQVLNLEPLRIAEDVEEAEDLRANEAIRLFLDRAHRADSSFRIATNELPIVADICRKVDGLPLAIELAAARAPVFGVRYLAEQLATDIAVLEVGGGRQRSLADVLDWSIELLDSDTASVLAVASLFEGGFQLDHLAEVHGRSPVVSVGRLVSASLANRVANTEPVRFKIPMPARIHVRNSLGAPPDAIERFVGWGRRFVAEVTQALGLPGESVSRRRLVAETSNVVATVKTALRAGRRDTAFEMAEALGKSGLTGNPAIVGLLDEIADSCEPADGATAIGALAAAARSSAMRGRREEALSRAQRAEDLAGGTWQRSLYMVAHARGLIAYLLGDTSRAVELLDRVVTDERVPIEERAVAALDQALALGQAGDLVEARGRASRAHDLALAHTGESVVAHALFVIGTIDLLEDPSKALETFDAAVNLSRRAESRLTEHIAWLCRIVSLMQLDREDEARDEVPDLIDALAINGTRSLSLVRVVATMAMRAGDVETASLLAHAYDAHSEAARFGIFVNATKQLEQLSTLFTSHQWSDLRIRASELSEQDVLDLARAVAEHEGASRRARTPSLRRQDADPPA